MGGGERGERKGFERNIAEARKGEQMTESWFWKMKVIWSEIGCVEEKWTLLFGKWPKWWREAHHLWMKCFRSNHPLPKNTHIPLKGTLMPLVQPISCSYKLLLPFNAFCRANIRFSNKWYEMCFLGQQVLRLQFGCTFHDLWVHLKLLHPCCHKLDACKSWKLLHGHLA